MFKRSISVGGDTALAEAEATLRFLAWHRAERGEAVNERHWHFESWRALALMPWRRPVGLLRA